MVFPDSEVDDNNGWDDDVTEWDNTDGVTFGNKVLIEAVEVGIKSEEVEAVLVCDFCLSLGINAIYLLLLPCN